MYYSKEEAEKEYGQLSDFYKNDPKSKIWEAGAIGRIELPPKSWTKNLTDWRQLLLWQNTVMN